MEWLKNWVAQIQAQLGELSVTQKMLIASLSVIAFATILVVALYTGQPEMVPLIERSASESQRLAVVSYLDSRGEKYEVRGDQILVPASRRASVAAAIQTDVAPDQGSGFALLVEQQSWWQSNEQYRQLYNIALQNELSRTVGRMRNVDKAKVIISHPKLTGFAATHRRPSASVNIEMQAGSLNQATANAIAGLVSGAVAEMSAEDVIVIDAKAGRQFRAREDDQMIPGDFLELVQHQERLYRDKLTDALAYIPHVIVAVNVEMQTTRRQRESTSFDKGNSVTLITHERSRTENTSEPRNGGEPGARSNIGADIAGSGGNGRSATVEETESEFNPYAGVTHLKEVELGGVPTRVSATVNVPRSYFVSIFMQGKAEDAPEPDDAALQAIYTEHLDRIRKQIEPLMASKDAGQLVVDVYPDAPAQVAAAGVGVTGTGGMMALFTGETGRFVIPGVLGVFAAFMLFMIARKAGQTAPIPGAAELAGLPPHFEDHSDIVGEASEVDAAMMGMELTDEQIASRKVAEQVGELVKSNPEEAASLIRQWVKQEG